MRAGVVVPRGEGGRRKVETVPGYVVVPPFQKVYSEKAGKGINLREGEKNLLSDPDFGEFGHTSRYTRRKYWASDYASIFCVRTEDENLVLSSVVRCFQPLYK